MLIPTKSGVDVPLLVVFVGAVGGFSVSGFIGLFSGAVILVCVYVLSQEWLGNMPDSEAEEGGNPETIGTGS